MLRAFNTHSNSSSVLSKMALAADVLSQGNEANKGKYEYVCVGGGGGIGKGECVCVCLCLLMYFYFQISLHLKSQHHL